MFSLLFLSCMSSHNSHIFLYLNGINMCIQHLYMFWNIRNLVLWRELENIWSSCFDDSKYGEFIPRQSEQQFKIQSYSGIFNHIIDEGQWYDDTASQALKCMRELSGNIWFLYSMKSILHLCKSLVDAELIYNWSSLANCYNLHLLIPYWSNMKSIHTLYPQVF